MEKSPANLNDAETSTSDASMLAEESFAHEQILGLTHLLANLRIAKELLSEGSADTAGAIRYIDHARFEAESIRYEAYNLISQRWPHVLGQLARKEISMISPMDLLTSMTEPYEQRAEKRGITFRVKTTAPNGEAPPPMLIDVFAMRRAFHNLLSNALKYSFRAPRSGNARYISIWCASMDRVQRTWGICIQNYGVGIEENELSSVFQPGYRGRLAKRENSLGVGLGLSEARKCIEGHGGHLRLSSKLVAEASATSEGGPQQPIYVTTARVILPQRTNINTRNAVVL